MILKLTIKGKVFSFEDRYSLAEAIVIEEGLGMNFVQWEQSIGTGSVRAMAGLVWLVLKRGGVDVSLADILSGQYDVNLDEIRAEPQGEGAPDPTPASSTSTGDATSESSPTPSDTGPGTSTGSPLSSSTT